MGSLLRYVSIVHFMEHRLRTLLTLAGVTLGIALLIAMQILTQTVFESFTASIESLAGDAVLQMTSGQAGVPEEALESIRAVQGVRHAVGVIHTKAYVEGLPEERLQVLGVDYLQDQHMRHYEFKEQDVEADDPLVILAQPDSILLTETFSSRYHIPLDSTVALITPIGRKLFTVRGILKVSGPVKAFGGNIVVMDLYAAQLVFERKDRFDQIDIAVEPHVGIEEVASRLAKEVGQYGQILRPQMRGRQVEAMLGTLRFGLKNSGALAMFLGLFMVYNTMYVSVLQRRREIGLLRCVGATRAQISCIFLGEAMLIGILGSLLGMVVGIWLARVLLPLLQETMNALVIGVEPSRLRLSNSHILLALGSGIGISLLATIFPIYQAVRIDPLAALDRERGQGAAPGRIRLFAILGLCLVLVALSFFFIEIGLKDARIGVHSIPFSLLGFSFLTPFFLVRVLPVIMPLLSRVSGVSGRLATDSLIRYPVRNAAAMSAVMVSVAAIFVMTVFLSSMLRSIEAHFSRLFKADLMVTAGSMFTGPQNISLTDRLVSEIRRIDGVEGTGSFRFLDIIYQGKETFLTALDMGTAARYGTFYMIDGDLAEIARSTEQGKEGVMVTNQFARSFSTGKGSTLELVTPSGIRQFPVVGEYMDYVSDTGGMCVDRRFYKKYWKDDTVDGIMVFVAKDADTEAVSKAIKDRFGKAYGVIVVSNKEAREAFIEKVTRSFRLTWAMKIVLVLLSGMGVMNTLIAMVLDRTREIGLLRALGATRQQMERTVLLEAVLLGVCGCSFGILLGVLGSLRIVKLSLSFLVGWYMEYSIPEFQVALEIVGAVLVCVVAGYYPARRAGRLQVLQAIAYE